MTTSLLHEQIFAYGRYCPGGFPPQQALTREFIARSLPRFQE